MPVTALAYMLERELRDARAAWIAEATTTQETKARHDSTFLQRKSAAGPINFHSLRHTYVTRLIEKGVDVKQVQELARHSTATLTLDRYAHAAASKFSETIERALPGTGLERMRNALRLSGVVSTKDHEKPRDGTNAREAENQEKRRKSEQI